MRGIGEAADADDDDNDDDDDGRWSLLKTFRLRDLVLGGLILRPVRLSCLLTRVVKLFLWKRFSKGWANFN